MTQYNKRCRDCAFFSLAGEGLDLDRCRFFDRLLSRKETMVSSECQKFVTREDEKDIEFYMPEQAERKQGYEKEIRRYSFYMVLFLVLGIGFFYLITKMA